MRSIVFTDDLTSDNIKEMLLSFLEDNDKSGLEDFLDAIPLVPVENQWAYGLSIHGGPLAQRNIIQGSEEVALAKMQKRVIPELRAKAGGERLDLWLITAIKTGKII